MTLLSSRVDQRAVSSTDTKAMPSRLTPRMREAMVSAARQYAKENDGGNSPDVMYEAAFAAVQFDACEPSITSGRFVRTITHGTELWQGGAKLAVASSEAIATEIASAMNVGAHSDAREAHTYASTQATNCASCGEHKHTPLRIDWMGGYVCLTCIDHELERFVALTDDQRAAIEFALGACAGHVAGERHVLALESLLSAAQEAR
ncbi:MULTISPECIES: hypothetical protein [Burkholderia]|nr:MULTISPECIES: hypothetical protein [Burkholderia]